MKSIGHFPLLMTSCLRDVWRNFGSSLFLRNPRRFLIRTCQVSIEVPSPPQVSIETELTNKNSLLALFSQNWMLPYCTFLLSISCSVFMFEQICNLTCFSCLIFKILYRFCLNRMLTGTFFCKNPHFLEVYEWFVSIHLVCLCVSTALYCKWVYALFTRNRSLVVRQRSPGSQEIKATCAFSVSVLLSKWMGMGKDIRIGP